MSHTQKITLNKNVILSIGFGAAHMPNKCKLIEKCNSQVVKQNKREHVTENEI